MHKNIKNVNKMGFFEVRIISQNELKLKMEIFFTRALSSTFFLKLMRFSCLLLSLNNLTQQDNSLNFLLLRFVSR